MANDSPARASDAGLNVEVLRTVEQLRGLSVRWNEALSRSEANSPFLTWDWIWAWLTAVAGEVDPEVYVVADGNGKVLGIAPFCITGLPLFGGYRYRCLRFMGEPGVGGEYADVILVRGAEVEVGAALADAFDRCGRRWDCAWLPKAAGWTGAPERLSALFDPRSFTRRSRPCTFAMVSLPDSGMSFMEKAPRNLRSALRRTQKQLEGGERVEFACLTKSADILPLLDAFAELHQKRWQGAGQLGAFERRPGLLRFFRVLCSSVPGQDLVRLCILRQGDAVVAAQFGVLYLGVYYQIQEGYDPTRVPGLGNYLRWRSIEAFVQEGIRIYDFMAGRSEHKRRWGAVERGGWDSFFVRHSLRTFPIWFLPLWPGGRYLREIDR